MESLELLLDLGTADPVPGQPRPLVVPVGTESMAPEQSKDESAKNQRDSTLVRLIRSLLRLKSVSSQASPSSPEFATPASPGCRAGGAGGAFSWSLRCSSWRTSSVFSRWRSPGPGVTMALWQQQHTPSRELQATGYKLAAPLLPDHGGGGPRVVLWLGGAAG